MILNSDVMECVYDSAKRYELPAELVLAIIETEGGGAGKIHKNKNGTVDIGLMQINSVHLPELRKHNITYNALLYKPCVNIEVGTWLLRKGFGDKIDYRDSDKWWRSVGNFHSKTPKFNMRYQKKIWNNLQKTRPYK